MLPLDEATLPVAWQGGDRQAGAAIVERHFEALYRFFRSKVSGEVDRRCRRSARGTPTRGAVGWP